MADLKIRCSSIGKLMTEPKSLKNGPLSVGAKTHIRELAAQEIFGVDFEISSKQIAKGIACEDESISLLNRVRGLSLAKNTERRTNEWITGECDLFDAQRACGHDLKTSWSAATFPIALVDCEDKLYEFQMRGYMWLWDCPTWEVNYALVDTPEELCKYEPMQLHVVSHIPENMRITTWTVTRDEAIEKAIAAKVEAARLYYAEVIWAFDRDHGLLKDAAAPVFIPPWNLGPQPLPRLLRWLPDVAAAAAAELVLNSGLVVATPEGDCGPSSAAKNPPFNYSAGEPQAIEAQAKSVITVELDNTPFLPPVPDVLASTITIGAINTRFDGVLTVNAESLKALGLIKQARPGPGAHFLQSDWPAICAALTAFITNTKDKF